MNETQVACSSYSKAMTIKPNCYTVHTFCVLVTPSGAKRELK